MGSGRFPASPGNRRLHRTTRAAVADGPTSATTESAISPGALPPVSRPAGTCSRAIVSAGRSPRGRRTATPRAGGCPSSRRSRPRRPAPRAAGPPGRGCRGRTARRRPGALAGCAASHCSGVCSTSSSGSSTASRPAIRAISTTALPMGLSVTATTRPASGAVAPGLLTGLMARPYGPGEAFRMSPTTFGRLAGGTAPDRTLTHQPHRPGPRRSSPPGAPDDPHHVPPPHRRRPHRHRGRPLLRRPRGARRQRQRRLQGRTASGSCTNATWKLKGKADSGRIEIEFEVDSNKAGQVWAVKITDNGPDGALRQPHHRPVPAGSFRRRPAP